jgi:hypothetical protein
MRMVNYCKTTSEQTGAYSGSALRWSRRASRITMGSLFLPQLLLFCQINVKKLLSLRRGEAILIKSLFGIFDLYSFSIFSPYF